MGASIDAYVGAHVRRRLRDPGLRRVLEVRRSDPMGEQMAALRARLVKFEQDYDGGLVDGRRFKLATDKVKAQLADIERASGGQVGRARTARILSATDPSADWSTASLMERRAVLDFFFEVSLLPAERGVKFQPSTVVLVPR